jgi:hypothetical protein
VWIPLPVMWLPITSFPVMAASGDVTSGSSTSLHLLKYDFVRTDILLAGVLPWNELGECSSWYESFPGFHFPSFSSWKRPVSFLLSPGSNLLLRS